MTTLCGELNLEAELFERQWWFTRIYTHGFDGADPLITQLLPALVAEGRALGLERWFFMRYLDTHGPHVRLRVLGNRRVLDRLQRAHQELQQQVEDSICTLPTRHEFIAALPRTDYEGRQGTGVHAALYEPEVAKYGGPEGTALAEGLFEFSSDLALWACDRFEKTTDRADLATLLLGDVGDSLLRGPNAASQHRQQIGWDQYWDRHLRWWTAHRGDQGDAAREQIQHDVYEQAPEIRSSLIDTARLPGVASWRRRWWLAFDSYLARAQAVGVDRSPQHLAFHQAHMMLNRLGFLPPEEAVLGVRARHWHPRRI